MPFKKTFFLTLALYYCAISSACFAQGHTDVILADFENGIPGNYLGDPIELKFGYRDIDMLKLKIVSDGGELSNKSLFLELADPQPKDIFLRGKVRRMYLATGSASYDPRGPNALSFWIKVPEDSSLFGERDRFQLNVSTWHWRPGDMTVGGKNNRSLATDSMMYGYSYLSINKKAHGKWINIILSPSAFLSGHAYLHFYAAQATTDELGFFQCVRQLQFHINAKTGANETIQFDQIKLVHKQPTALFKKSHYKATIKCAKGPVKVPVTIINPTDIDRKYRAFISSNIGVNRKTLLKAYALSDNTDIVSNMMRDSESDGGMGAADLLDANGDSITKNNKEITIPAKGAWSGVVIHYINPDMLGEPQSIQIKSKEFAFRRDTLLTSIIVWEPYDAGSDLSQYVTPLKPLDYADDENRYAPPGFPEQKSPAKGWQSQDVPLDQVGGYFVSEIKLKE